MKSLALAYGSSAMLALSAISGVSAQTPVSAAPKYAEILNRLNGGALNIDSLYHEAITRRLSLDSAIGRSAVALFGNGLTTIDILRRMRSDPALVMHDPDSIVSAYSAGLSRARATLPKIVDTPEDAPIRVRAIEASKAASSPPAGYHRANRDSLADTAILFVNAYQPGGIARMNILLGIAHEAYPGHHFQTLYALARKTSPDVTPDNGAYVEGWGIYSERLADETGLYDTDPIAKLGYLIHMYDVFMALQVDIGIHYYGWTHAAAVDTLVNVAGRPLTQAESYANRHLATPGQLASYGIGVTAIVRQRERAQAALGQRFDLRKFHAAVLADGQSTLPQMEKRVGDWIAQTR